MSKQQLNQQLLQSLQETQTAALMNKLIQSQHQILVSQLAKIQKLNELITKKKQIQNQRHNRKMDNYDITIKSLEEKIKAKESLLEQFNIIGGNNEERKQIRQIQRQGNMGEQL